MPGIQGDVEKRPASPVSHVSSSGEATATILVPPDIPPLRRDWQAASDRPLDEGGPVDRPFERMGAGFAAIPACVHLEAVAARHPDKLAVADAHVRLTYAQVVQIIRNLAQLIMIAVLEDQSVGLLVGNSAWYPVALLASMAAGRPAVPLNPRDPPLRNSEIAADAQLPAIVGVGPESFAGWPGTRRLAWIDITQVSATSAAMPFAANASVDAPAFVLYTSGSTGKPKGIVNSQRALLQRVQQYVDACHINSDDVFLPLSGAATIAGCREIMSSLLTGATLHLADVEALGLRAVRRLFANHGVTIVYLVPALLRALLTPSEADSFKALRVARIGGEKVLRTDVDLVRRVAPRDCFIQVSYSSTETTGTQWFMPHDAPQTGATVPVGYVLPGISYRLVDEAGDPAPAGTCGELVIRSRYVTLGTWEGGRIRRQEADPDDPGLHIIATGDLAEVGPDGLVTIVGRKGRQIKINGRRIEPAELEVVLRRSPGVDDAVAIVSEANELVAFVAMGASAAAAPSSPATTLRETIRRQLPPGLQPTRLHIIAEMPRLPGGKVDVVKLRGQDGAARQVAAVAAPAATAPTADRLDVAAAVTRVWKQILNRRDASGRWDEAGGDSLKLLRCVMELEDLIGRELDLEAFTVDMTAADMVQAAGHDHGAGAREDLGEGKPPLLFLVPGSVGYGPSLAAFGAAMAEVVRVMPVRHPDLGTILGGGGSIEAMTETALDQILHAQPEGDVRLLGYSLGGAVAFEVAARLIAAGRQVKFLGILDTNVGRAPADAHLSESIARTWQRLRAHRVTLYRTCCRMVAKSVAQLGREQEFGELLDRRWWQRLPATHFMLKLELEEVLRMRAFGEWLRQPKPRLPITGTLFRCDRRGMSADLGWSALFATVDVVPIAGGHLDLVIEPHLSRNRPLIEQAIAATCG